MTAHNAPQLRPTDRKQIRIPIPADGGSMDGGILGYTGRDWFYVGPLVPERLRGQDVKLAIASEPI